MQPPTAGIVGAEYPPKPVADDWQHLKALGPGQRPERELLAQSEVQRQFPGLAPQEGFEQHFTSLGSLGQAPEMVTPPLEEHVEVETQTPKRDGCQLMLNLCHGDDD